MLLATKLVLQGSSFNLLDEGECVVRRGVRLHPVDQVPCTVGSGWSGWSGSQTPKSVPQAARVRARGVSGGGSFTTCTTCTTYTLRARAVAPLYRPTLTPAPTWGRSLRRHHYGHGHGHALAHAATLGSVSARTLASRRRRGLNKGAPSAPGFSACRSRTRASRCTAPSASTSTQHRPP